MRSGAAMFSISGANTIMEQQHQQHQQQLQQQQGLQAQGQEQPLAHDGAPSAAASNDEDPSGPQPEERLVLKLRPRRKKGVKWTEDTVDNEGMGKKSSKKCCIFHKQRAWGDWSDGDTDTDSESDGSCHHCGEHEHHHGPGGGDDSTDGGACSILV